MVTTWEMLGCACGTFPARYGNHPQNNINPVGRTGLRLCSVVSCASYGLHYNSINSLNSIVLLNSRVESCSSSAWLACSSTGLVLSGVTTLDV